MRCALITVDVHSQEAVIYGNEACWPAVLNHIYDRKLAQRMNVTFRLFVASYIEVTVIEGFYF